MAEKNLRYDLIKLLHCSMDDVWRIEKHYLKDVKPCKRCQKILKQIRKDVSKHIEELKKELSKHL